GRLVGRPAAARHHHHRQPPRPAALGDALRLGVARLPRAQALLARLQGVVLPVIFGLEFPPIENLVEWPNAFGPEDSWYGFNKIALINLIALAATALLFLVAGRSRTLVPKGAQNLVESAV